MTTHSTKGTFSCPTSKPALLLTLLLWPAAALGQVLVSSGSNSGLRLWHPIGTDWWLDPSQGRFDLRLNGGASPLMSLTSAGLLGVGTAAPVYKLDVAGDINLSGTLRQNGAPFSGAGQWTSGGGLIYYSGGNVGIGTTSPQASLDLGSKTDAVIVPAGTAAQRPGSPAAGAVRYNTTSSSLEFFNGTSWNTVGVASTLSATGGTTSIVGNYTIHIFTSNGTFTPANSGVVEILVVAGGGSGGGSIGGGGGAGGVIYSPAFPVSAQAYPVTVGAGGASVSDASVGNNGSDSVFGSLTAKGGGGGGYYANWGLSTPPARSGGSGGGGGGDDNFVLIGAAGTAGQGYNGGASRGHGNPWGSGGGGGSGGAGGNGTSEAGGSGGPGTAYSISGSAVTYGGGGGGSAFTYNVAVSQGPGGAGGGGAAGGVSGAPNTGGGGGAASGYIPSGSSGAGGSGIVIIRYSRY